MRYQLLKTTPYLGGQVRWDIPLYFHYDKGVHHIDTPELHIVPLDDSIVFNEGNDWPTLNYSHLENVKHLFSQIGDAFYSCEGEWTGNHWLYNQGDKIDPYSHTYMMGTHRVRFTRYGKQFSYLLPLWISEETDPANLAFEVSIRIPEEERDHIVRRVFGLSEALQGYMKDYLDKSARYTEPDPSAPSQGYLGVSDDLLSIKFNPNQAYITGVQADVAKYTTKDVSYLIDAILNRELPMLEFDNMLVSKFRESNMIAQQLINLNFLFNMEDLSYFTKTTLLGKEICISIRVLYGSQYLPLKDFFTNYEEIPVYRTDLAAMDHNHNVCDYMGDQKIIDYMYTNKFTQPISHWSMVENPGYIYNFYDGFAPTFLDGGQLQRVKGRYYDQADVAQEDHTVYNNAAYWCKTFDATDLTDAFMTTYISGTEDDPGRYMSPLTLNTDTAIAYLNNNRYDIHDLLETTETVRSVFRDIYMHNIVRAPGSVDVPAGVTPPFNKSIYINQTDKGTLIYFQCDDKSKATFKRYAACIRHIIDHCWDTVTHISGLSPMGIVTDSLVNNCVIYWDCTNPPSDPYKPSDDEIKTLLLFLADLCDTWVPPYRIDFSRTTITSDVDAFEGWHPTERNMYRLNAYQGYVLRYTGGLCPMFVDPDDENYYNIVYSYKQWGDINTPEVQQYNTFLKTGMEPYYPSIGYYSFDKEHQHSAAPAWYSDNTWPWEVSWGNEGHVYVLPEIYQGTKVVNKPLPYDDTEEEKMWELLYNYLTGIGIVVDPDDTWMKHNIKNLYKISYNFDYLSETDVDNIKYYVRFDLR